VSRTRRLALAWVACLLAAPAAAQPVSGPRLDYVLQCMGCHGAGGDGAPGRVPPLGAELGRLVAIPAGRAYLVQVPGVAQSALDDARVAALLNWLLHRFSSATLPADLLPYTAGEVTRLRAHPLADATATRRAVVATLDHAERPR
jgi:mono/diheme cytochrome c family protein